MSLRKPRSRAVSVGVGASRPSTASVSVLTSSATSRAPPRSAAVAAAPLPALKIEEPTDDSDYVLVGDVLVLRDPTAYRARQTRSLAALEKWRVSRFLTAPRRRSWAVGASTVPARVALAPRVNRRPRPVYEERSDDSDVG